MKCLDVFYFERVEIEVVQSQEGDSVLEADMRDMSLSYRGLTFTSNPNAYALTKSAPFCSAPTSLVCFEV